MDRDMLIAQSPTAQVRIFAEELLRDGQIHSRREISQYIKQQRKKYDLQEYTAGHESGGIQQATANCEKLGRASYQLKTTSRDTSEPMAPISRSERVVQILNHTVAQLSVLAREIDFISANQAEMQELEKLRSIVENLNEIKNSWG